MTKVKSEVGTYDKPIPYPGEVIFVKGGTFTMGSTDGDEDERKTDGTLPTVAVSSFRLARTEFTMSEAFNLFNKTKNKKLKGVLENLIKKNSDGLTVYDYALAGASYQEATMICTELGGRLPTAAEIEYVAKQGKKNRTHDIPLNVLRAVRKRQPVCGYTSQLQNCKNFCDITGGLWEMTADEYVERAYDSINSTNPVNRGLLDLMTPNVLSGESAANLDDHFVEVRGGYWKYGGWRSQSADRNPGNTNGNRNIGFRVAWSVSTN